MNSALKKMKWMLPVILSIGFIMRAPITTLPLMLKELATNLHVAQSQLGILTTLPLVMFLLFSNFASVVLNRFGFKKAMMLALGMLTAGSFLRLIITMPTMLVGTCLIGIGIAHLNVFMPSLVAAYFPTRIGLYTTFYSFAMIFGNAIFNLITAPVARAFGWKSMMWLLVLTTVLALIGWLLVMTWLPEKIQHRQKNQTDHAKSNLHVWNNKHAWPFLLTFGAQATMNYTFSAWMPALMAFHHVSADIIGVITASFALIDLPIAIFLPQLLVVLNKKGKNILIGSASISGVIAAAMLFVQNTSAVAFWMTESLLGGFAISVFFIFTMTMFAVKTDDPYATAKLSGMAQAGGYLMSAFGPSLYGLAFAANPTGNLQNSVYLALVLVAFISSLMIVRIEKV